MERRTEACARERLRTMKQPTPGALPAPFARREGLSFFADDELMSSTEPEALVAVVISGSPSAASRSRRLLDHVAAALAAEGVDVTRVDLAALPSDDLLGRTRSRAIERALEAVAGAQIVAVSTPVYRATYTGLLKVFFDLFAPGMLVDKVAIPLASGGSAAHRLVLDHGLRPLLASVGATVVRTGTYATDADLRELALPDPIANRLDRAVREALSLSITSPFHLSV